MSVNAAQEAQSLLNYEDGVLTDTVESLSDAEQSGASEVQLADGNEYTLDGSALALGVERITSRATQMIQNVMQTYSTLRKAAQQTASMLRNL